MLVCDWNKTFLVTVVRKAVSLHFWFCSVVEMSCSFLKNGLFGCEFYFPGLGMFSVARFNISVLALAFQENGSYGGLLWHYVNVTKVPN